MVLVSEHEQGGEVNRDTAVFHRASGQATKADVGNLVELCQDDEVSLTQSGVSGVLG